MNILHIISEMTPKYGGPYAVLKDLAAYQAMSGPEVTICTVYCGKYESSASASVGSALSALGVSYVAFKAQSPMRVSYKMAAWLKRHISDFDLLHIHGLYRFPVTYAAWLSHQRNVPYLITPHGSLDPYLYRQSRYGAVALPLKRLYERCFDLPNLHHASAIHYTAREEAERAAFLKLRAPSVIVPNGIDWQPYETLPAAGAFRHTIGLDAATPLVLFLGRINFKKGLDLLVPAFAEVVKTLPDARLSIVGPDNEGYGKKVRGWCREHNIEDKVIFVDHLEPERVREAYVDADVFALPSYTENFGMTVVEAMACACPVVISDQVNIWREIDEAGAGVVVPLDIARIADAIKMLLLGKEKAGVMGTRGRQAAKERYTWPPIVEKLSEIYRQLISDSAARRR